MWLVTAPPWSARGSSHTKPVRRAPLVHGLNRVRRTGPTQGRRKAVATSGHAWVRGISSQPDAPRPPLLVSETPSLVDTLVVDNSVTSA